jgi:hypothetical protein
MVMKQTEILTGLITFEQVKQAVESFYSEFLKDIDDDNEDEGGYFDEATDVNELVDILDGLGFNGDEAYEFIFDSILK